MLVIFLSDIFDWKRANIESPGNFPGGWKQKITFSGRLNIARKIFFIQVTL